MTRRLQGAEVSLAAALLRGGALVAFPTETVYGLGAYAFDATAVAGIYAAKGRPSDNPLIVHVPSIREAEPFCVPSALARMLAQAFWPGPLTLVMKARAHGECYGQTIAVRCPQHALAQALLRETQRPLAAPSANRSGRPSPTNAEHVAADLDGRIDAILDGGACAIGLESTVLDVTGTAPLLLRSGAVTPDQIADACGMKPERVADENVLRRSPGTRYRHYSPDVPILLFEGQGAQQAMAAEAERCAGAGLKTVCLGFYEGRAPAGAIDLGSPKEAAQSLFHWLRTLEHDCDRLLIEAPKRDGIGEALYNRLSRAASERRSSLPPRGSV